MKDASLAGTNLNRYYHVCAFFGSRDEEYRVLTPFFKEGLDDGEKLMHIVDPTLRSDHSRRLQQAGIGVDGCVHSGQLEILTWQDAYLKDGVFDKTRMLNTVSEAIAAGQSQGYPRIRIMGNMAWVFTGAPGTEQVIEYEAQVNEVLARSRQLAICVYDLSRLTGTMMMDILRSHPLTLVGGVLHENPFYSPASQLLDEIRSREAGVTSRPLGASA